MLGHISFNILLIFILLLVLCVFLFIMITASNPVYSTLLWLAVL